MPAWSKLRTKGHDAHGRDDRLPGLGIHAARQPARQPLPGEARLGQCRRAPLTQVRTALVGRDGRQIEPLRPVPVALRRSLGVVVVTAVEQVAEQRRLGGVLRLGWVSSMTSAMRSWRVRPS